MTRTVATQGSWAGSTAYIARPKSEDVKALTGRDFADEKHAFGEKPLFSLVPPSSGMFVWVSNERHFQYVGLQRTDAVESRV